MSFAYISGDELFPSSAFDSHNNKYLYVYQKYNGADWDIKGRVLSASGATEGAELDISDTGVSYDQVHPYVSYNSTNHKYLVVWADFRNNGNVQLFGQYADVSAAGYLLKKDGSVGMENFLIVTGSGSGQLYPRLAYNSTDNLFLMTLITGAYSIYGKAIGGSDGALGNEFYIEDAGADHWLSQNQLGYNSADNTFFSAWSTAGPPAAIYGRVISNTGVPTGSNVPIISDAADHYLPGRIVHDSVNNQYLICWGDFRDSATTGVDIYCKRLGSDGTQIGSEILITNAAGNQMFPSTSYDSRSQRFSVTYEDASSGSSDIYYQIVNTDGTLNGGNTVLVNSAGSQASPTALNSTNCDSTLFVYENRAPSPTVIGTALTGAGCLPGVTINPESYNFGNVAINNSSVKDFRITNDSFVDLDIGAMALEGVSPDNFSLSVDNCSNQTLVRSADCTFNVTFSPQPLGAIGATLSIPSNAPDTPKTVALSGVGIQYSLDVIRNGTGSGTVSGSGINCGATCTQQYNYNATAILTAAAASSSDFAGWTNCDSPSGAQCTMTMTQDKTVTAAFNLKPFTITPSAGANGSLSPSTPQTVYYGGSQTFTITPEAGYHISDVTADGTSAGTPTSYPFDNVTANHTISASFAINTYNITANAGANGTISCNPATVNHGSSTTCTITPNANYLIEDVKVNDVSKGAVSSPYTINNITVDTTVAVTFIFDTHTSYTITVNSGPNGSISPAVNTTVTYNNNQAFTITPDTGYHVESLTVDGASIATANSYTFNNVAANHSISVTFAINTYSVTATAGPNGSLDATTPSPRTIAHNGTTSFKFNASTGYHITGITGCGIAYTNTGNSVNTYTVTTNPVTSDCTVSAAFGINSYIITATSGDHGSVSPISMSANHGENKAFVVTPTTGYHIDTVTGCDGALSGSTYTTGIITAACTVSATFAINTYTVTTNPGANGNISCSPTTIAHGSTSTCSITPNTGYHIASVTGCTGALSGNTYTTGVATADCTVAATFAVNSYTVTANAGANGGISPASVTLNHGGSQAFNLMPNTGYHIDTVTGCGGALSGSTYTTGAITSDCTVSATFAINTYTITMSSGANGSISCTQTTVNHGSSSTCTLTPDTGYHIDSVTGCGGSLSGSTYTTGAITADCTVSAAFAINTYTITANAGANGTISPSGDISSENGSKKTFAISPNSGYSIADVKVDGVSVGTLDNYTFSNITTTHSISATFAINKYQLNVTKNSSGGIIKSDVSGINCGNDCTESLATGTTVTLTATPKEDLSQWSFVDFTGWSGACTGTDTTCTVIMNSDKEITANFKVTYPLFVSLPSGCIVTDNFDYQYTTSYDDIFGISSNFYEKDTVVTLTASNEGCDFTGWSGWDSDSCSSAGNTCTITMDRFHQIDAGFNPRNFALIISSTNQTKGNGYVEGLANEKWGSIKMDPIGISCGVGCIKYPKDTDVTLTAIENEGYSFKDWYGIYDCEETGVNSCKVKMDANQSVISEFKECCTVTATIYGYDYGMLIPVPDEDGDDGFLYYADYKGKLAIGLYNNKMDQADPETIPSYIAEVRLDGTKVANIPGHPADSYNYTLDNIKQDHTLEIYFTPDNTYELRTFENDKAKGYIVSSGYECGYDCWAIERDETISAFAEPEAGHVFNRWDGACTGSDDYCEIVMTSNKTVTAYFGSPSYHIEVTKEGNGKVTSNPAGISCGTICSSDYEFGTDLTLTAVPDPGYDFVGWSEDICDTMENNKCKISVKSDEDFTAGFKVKTFTITALVEGNGGSISPTGTFNVAYNSSTIFTIAPDSGYRLIDIILDGVSVPITKNQKTYNLANIKADHAIKFRFASNIKKLTVANMDSKLGIIESVPSGIKCGNEGKDCTGDFEEDGSITLTAILNDGSIFNGWSGSCEGKDLTCAIVMNDNKKVTADFGINAYTLSVAKDGDGGTIMSTPSGINCGKDCSNTFNYGKKITLEAKAIKGYDLIGWSGDCETVPDNANKCITDMTTDKNVTAHFSPKTYKLTVKNADTNGGTVIGNKPGTHGNSINCGDACEESYLSGDNVVLTATANQGFDFKGWTGTCGNNKDKVCELTIDESNNVTAKFEARQFTLNVSKNIKAGGIVSSDDAKKGIKCDTECLKDTYKYDYGTVIALTAAPSKKYNFTGWTGCDTEDGYTCIVNMTNAKDVTANFSMRTFTLGLTNNNPAGGVIKISGSNPDKNCIDNCSEVSEYGDKVSLTAVPVAGYIFNGWGGDCKDKDNTCTVNMVDSDKTVTADFKIKTYTLTTKVTSGIGTLTADPQGTSCGDNCMAYNHGAQVTLTASPDIAYKFKDWTDDCNKAATGTCVLTMDKGRKATTKFEIKKLDLTVSRNDAKGGKVTGNGINCGPDCKMIYDYGKTVTLTATANDAYSFTGWTGECSGTGNCTVTMTDARSVKANFTMKTSDLTVTNNNTNGGTITGSGINCGADCSETYNYNTSVTLTANPATGYDFTGWTGSCSGKQKTCTVKMNNNKTAAAGFAIQTFTITASVTGSGGIISPSGATTVNYGNSQTYTITPNTGYQVDKLKIDGTQVTSAASYTFSSITSRHTINVSFEKSKYQLSADKPTGGAIKGGGINCGTACSKTYEYGDIVTLTADPNTGYTFSGWGGSCSGTGTTCTLTMDLAKNVTASFTIKTFILTITSANGSVPGTGTYNYNASVTLTASPNTGYEFTGWTGAGCSGINECVVKMTSDKSVTAKYTIEKFTINASSGANGSISPSGKKTVAYNGSLTFTISPANNRYVINDVLVDGSSVGAVLSYTFRNINADHTIKATFKRK